MSADPQDLLRAAGLRVTSQRIAVLTALDARSHADADAIHRAVQEQLPDITVQSVYVVLAALTDAGILRRIEPAGSPARYERRVGDNHHHVICSACGAVEDVDCVVGAAPCLHPSEVETGSGGGWRVQTAEITFWGVCPACQAAAAGTAPGDRTSSDRSRTNRTSPDRNA